MKNAKVTRLDWLVEMIYMFFKLESEKKNNAWFSVKLNIQQSMCMSVKGVD